MEPLTAGVMPLLFLSTPSARRATEFSLPVCVDVEISIHALREEGDHDRAENARRCKGISIHALREEGDAFFASDNAL